MKFFWRLFFCTNRITFTHSYNLVFRLLTLFLFLSLSISLFICKFRKCSVRLLLLFGYSLIREKKIEQFQYIRPYVVVSFFLCELNASEKNESHFDKMVWISIEALRANEMFIKHHALQNIMANERCDSKERQKADIAFSLQSRNQPFFIAKM